MHLSKLSIQNFRIIGNAVLDLKGTPFVCIRGKKFAGKSSIGQAISMILANTAEGLDGQGRSFEVKIKDGESKSVLTAHIQGKHLIERVVTLNTNTSGRTSRSVCLDDPDFHPLPFDNFLARYKDALNVATNTNCFGNLSEKDQSNLIAKLVLPARYDFPKDKIEAVEKAIGAGVVDFEGEPFSVITLSHKKLYDERAVVNRQVKEFSIPDALPVAKGVNSESLQTELKSIREQRSKLQTERDAAVSKANDVEVKRATLKTKIEGLRGVVDRGKNQLTALESSILGAEKIKALTSVAARADELTKLKSEHSSIHTAIMAYNKEISRFKEISEQGKTCPVCDQEIDSSKMEAAIAELEKEHAEADRNIQELDKKIEAIGDVQAANDSLKNHENAVKAKTELETSLLETVKTGKATRVELDALGEPSNATIQFNDPLSTLQLKEDQINEQLRPVIAAEERAKEIKLKTEQKAKLEAKSAAVDELVKYFDKDGIKAKLISEYVGKFQNSITDVMEIFGYNCSLTLDPMDFNIVTARGYKGPVKELSGAETHMFYATLQTAVSIAAGIGLVVIDEIQELGDELLALFFRKIFGLIQDGKLEQAIMIGYSLDKNLPKPQAPGSSYYYVTDGVVEKLK